MAIQTSGTSPASRRRRRAITGLVLTVAVLTGLCLWAVWWVQRPLPLTLPQVEVSVEAGSTPRDVAQRWVEAGVHTSPWLLYQWFRVSGQARKIRAGTYAVDATTSPKSLLDKMVQGDESLEMLRIIEGWTFKQVRAELARSASLRPTTALWSESQIMSALGLTGTPAEGRFYPDTYRYSRGVSDLAVLKRAAQAMQRKLESAWQQRSATSTLKSPAEALILASIVEKETGQAADRPLIAGVFANRLRIGMPLQTDPTVIYGLGDQFDGNLRKRDLQSDTPFNTYTRRGLPPTPIAMPGWASLRAAVQPAATPALYFVARGDGSSAFSATLADHNRAVNQFQRNPQKSQTSAKGP